MDMSYLAFLSTLLLTVVCFAQVLEIRKLRKTCGVYKRGYTSLKKAISDAEIKLRLDNNADINDVRARLICSYQAAHADVHLSLRKINNNKHNK